jgi:hypothetical protein
MARDGKEISRKRIAGDKNEDAGKARKQDAGK